MRIFEKGVAGGVEREERNVEEKYQYKGEWLDWKLGNKPNWLLRLSSKNHKN